MVKGKRKFPVDKAFDGIIIGEQAKKGRRKRQTKGKGEGNDNESDCRLLSVDVISYC